MSNKKETTNQEFFNVFEKTNSTAVCVIGTDDRGEMHVIINSKYPLANMAKYLRAIADDIEKAPIISRETIPVKSAKKTDIN